MENWIKIINEKPPEYLDVLVWNCISQTITCRLGDTWYHMIDWYDYDHITHWKHSKPPEE